MNLEAIHMITSSLKQFLEKNSIKESDLKTIQFQLDILFRLLPLPQYYCIPARLERLTINENLPQANGNRINDIKYLKYPPAQYVNKFGRCNVVKQSMLYGAFHFSTVINELKPEIGKAITHTKWLLKEELPLKMFPVFFITQIENEPHNELSLDIKMLHRNFVSSFSEEVKKSFDLSMEFLAKCFAKEVESSNHFDYFLSAYISKKVLEIKSLNYAGIIYPSVKTKLGFSNMAIKPDVFDDRFKLIEVRYEINDIQPGRNGINHVISRSTKFDFDKGLIIWED